MAVHSIVCLCAACLQRGKASLVIFSKLVYCSDFSDERLVQLAQRLWKHVDSASTVPVIVKVHILVGWGSR